MVTQNGSGCSRFGCLSVESHVENFGLTLHVAQSVNFFYLVHVVPEIRKENIELRPALGSTSSCRLSPREGLFATQLKDIFEIHFYQTDSVFDSLCL